MVYDEVLDAPWVKFYEPGVPATIDLPDESLIEMAERACAEAGKKIATEYFGATMTYDELGNSIARCAEGLRRLGVQAGDRVAILLPNSPQHIIAFYGALRVGAIVVEHNPLYTARELEEIFADHGARVAIAMDTAIEKIESQPNHVRPRTIVSVNLLKAFPLVKRIALSLPIPKLAKTKAALTNGAKGAMSWEDLLNAPQISRKHPYPASDDLAAIQYTSGTTGHPKGVMLTHRNLYANALQGAAWMHGAKTGGEVSYAMLPMFHAFGMTLYLTFGIYKQAHQVLFPRPDVDMALDAMKKRPPSIYCAVPIIYERTAKGATERGIDLSGVRWCISGAMTLPGETVELWEKVSGGLLVEGYGLTETAPVALGNPFHPSRRTGTIGIPFPSTYRKVVDPEDPTKDVEAGQPGELLLKGPQVFKGYWNKPDETAAAFTADGWLRTGDVVTLDEDGFATIVDRLKEIIITGGFNVSPTEVEAALRESPDVADAAVVGMMQERGDEMVVAAVVPAEGKTVDEAALRAFAKERLAAYKVPRRVIAVDELPKSMLGKVLRGKAREQIAAEV